MIKMYVCIEADDRLIERNFEGHYWTNLVDWQHVVLRSIPELAEGLDADREEEALASKLIEENAVKIKTQLGVSPLGWRVRILRRALEAALERIPHAIKR